MFSFHPKVEGARTPTRADNSDKKADAEPPIPTASNDTPVSQATDHPDTPLPPTPALTPALTGTTDDSDTDFQSAHSTTPSPRESIRGNFDTFNAEDKLIPGSFESGIGRERLRVSSVLTTVAQSSPTFSDSTVVSNHDNTITRR